MAFTRYYLVRREGREFIGPMQVNEFGDRLARLEFGLQDEVSGHCGPWVVMDRKDDMTAHYPELAKIFGEDLPLSWRESTGHAKVISRKDSRKDRKNKFAEKKNARSDFHQYIELRKRQSNARKIVALVVVSVSLIVGALIISKRDDLIGVGEVSGLATKADPAEFLSVMGIKVVPQAPKIARSGKLQAAWLPYLRMYAFLTVGSVEGFPQKTLRGDVPVVAPQECSVDFFKRRWKENSADTISFIQGRSAVKNVWTKLLAMDPDWVRRRPGKGWIKPRNYFEGCLMTALTAIRSLANDVSSTIDSGELGAPEILSAVARRLQFQLDAINSTTVSPMVDRTNFMNVLTCIESQSSLPALDLCRGVFDPSFKPLMEERAALAVLRIALSRGAGPLDKNLVGQLQFYGQKMPTEDYMSHFDLTPELKLMGYLTSASTEEAAVAKIEEEFPEIRFK